MSIAFTEEQQKVITLRNRSILVSAAAGSGKTAVLVERIFQKLTDPASPVPVNRLLVMTFTRAAAGEMKDRITKALEEALTEDPENALLQQQMTLVHGAQITTIDGFCAWILQNYFHLIGLDPSYRVADEGELRMLEEDVISQILEEAYAQEDPAFDTFVECFCPNKTDEDLKDLILSVHKAAMSHPDPETWLAACMDSYRITTVEELAGQPWLSVLWEKAGAVLSEAESMAREVSHLALSPGGPVFYDDTAREDILLLGELKEAVSSHELDKAVDAFRTMSFVRLTGKKTKEEDPSIREAAKDLRDEMKKMVQELGKNFFFCTADELLRLLSCSKGPLETLVSLTKAFDKRFTEEKRRRNILDFGDMEHLALQILLVPDPEHPGEPGIAARELSEKYDEVMVDEYQDSNFLQEKITQAVCGWVQHRKNLFMVGDVKQSIYRFRLARPELFMEKYHSFTDADSEEQRIVLHRNFRSRASVLESVNYLFRQIMGEDLGGITYDDAAALYPAAGFPEGEDPEFTRTEVLLVNTDAPEEMDEDEWTGDEEDGGIADGTVDITRENQDSTPRSAQEMEALAIGQRILAMVGHDRVVDKTTGTYRPVTYGDIVILLRSAARWSETFAEVLGSMGIPVYSSSRTGYFSAPEVVTLLDYLRICDNPRQDIPLAGVLRSPMVGCTNEELALLRLQQKEGLLYDCVVKLAEQGEQDDESRKADRTITVPEVQMTDPSLQMPKGEEADWIGLPASENNGVNEQRPHGLHNADMLQVLRHKMRGFLDNLNDFRRRSSYTPVHELIHDILTKTGYEYYVRALPDGAQRGANLAMLSVMAREYEKTSYRGLFNFIRYIEKMQKYEIDFGEANRTDAGGGAVQIMTIHHSKGLEFPIVFVSGLGKQFNQMDSNAALLVHPELGIGVDAVLPDRRIKAASLCRKLIGEQMRNETLGEELRILYVALTRAKEKLILTGTLKGLEKPLTNCVRHASRREQLLSLGIRQKAKTGWDYILPALSGHPAMDPLYRKYGLFPESSEMFRNTDAAFTITELTDRELVMGAVAGEADRAMDREILRSWDPEHVADEELRQQLRERFNYRYAVEEPADLPVKVSVSELKKRSYHEDTDYEEAAFDERPAPIIPHFMQSAEEENFTGAARGTAYHRVMECLDYNDIASDEAIETQIHQMVEQQKLGAEEAGVVRIRDIRRFLSTEIGQRMEAAALGGSLLREQPFMIARPGRELTPEWDTDRDVLVQGIIDAYFLEGEDIVLVDYKTDHVRPGEEQKLIDLYHVQLEDYACALERMTGRKVKESYIYSFALGEGIRMK